MALEFEVKQVVRRIAEAFDNFASEQGWDRGDYRILLRAKPDWGRFHVLLLARQFPGDTPRDQWITVMNFVTVDLDADDPDLIRSVSLTLRTFDQVEEGGIYAIGRGFEDVREMLVGGSAG